MGVTIYTCGTPSTKRPWISGCPDIAGAVKINAKSLPNPHVHVSRKYEEACLDEVETFLLRECPAKFDKLVAKGQRAVNENKPVIVQCLFGRDRSHAIARAIQKRCGRKVKCVVLLDTK